MNDDTPVEDASASGDDASTPTDTAKKPSGCTSCLMVLVALVLVASLIVCVGGAGLYFWGQKKIEDGSAQSWIDQKLESLVAEKAQDWANLPDGKPNEEGSSSDPATPDAPPPFDFKTAMRRANEDLEQFARESKKANHRQDSERPRGANPKHLDDVQRLVETMKEKSREVYRTERPKDSGATPRDQPDSGLVHISATAIDTRGPLSREQVYRVLNQRSAELGQCNAAGLEATTTLQISVSSTTGNVLAAVERKPFLPDKEVSKCLVDALKSTTFPAARKSGMQVVKIPMQLMK